MTMSLAASHGEVVRRILAIAADIAEVDASNIDTRMTLFREDNEELTLDLDSLDALEMGFLIADEFDIDPDNILEARPRTVEDLIQLLMSVQVNGLPQSASDGATQ